MASIVVLAGALLPVAASATATAGGPLRLRLSATTGLRPGQSVDYTVTGRALARGQVLDIWQCDADADADFDDLDDLNRACTLLGGRTIPEGAQQVTGTVTVQEVFTTYPLDPEPQGSVHCGDGPRDCSMVAIVFDGTTNQVEARDVVPVDVIPSPVAVGGPGLQDGSASVQVWVSGRPRARLQLAQCARLPGVARDIDSCLAGPTVVLSRRGQATTAMTVVPTLEVDGATPHDCLRRPCQVTSFDRTGAILGASDIPGSVPFADVTVGPSTGLAHGDVVNARIDSAIPAFSSYYVSICLASVLDDLPTAEGCYVFFPVIGPGIHDHGLIAYEQFAPYGGGPLVSCGDDPDGCIIGVGTPTTLAGYAPISFASSPGSG